VGMVLPSPAPEQARKCGVSLVCLDCASRDCAVVQQDLHRFPYHSRQDERDVALLVVVAVGLRVEIHHRHPGGRSHLQVARVAGQGRRRLLELV